MKHFVSEGDLHVVIAIEHQIITDAVLSLIKTRENIIVHQAPVNSEGILAACIETEADLVITDFEPRADDTICLPTAINENSPKTRILLLSSSHNADLAVVALAVGAHGFLSSQASIHDIQTAFDSLLAGYTYISADFVHGLVSARQLVQKSGNIFGLSSREVEVMRMAVRGFSNKEIAQSLDLSVRTVETHRNKVSRKTKFRDSNQLSNLSHLLVS